MRHSSFLLPIALVIIILLVLFSVITGRALDYDSSPTPTPEALLPRPTPVSAVTHNTDWQPVIRRFDGVDMALVPPGCFLMGSEVGDEDTKPIHPVCFDRPFWIDRYEVTNGQFAELGGRAGRESSWTDADRPRESITWHEASAFCALRGAQLPTEAEWEYAARGPDSLLFPWGDTFVTANTVFGGNAKGEPARVGSRPGGISWVGAHDLGGNVAEWVSSLHRPYPFDSADGRESAEDEGVRVVRGGSWFFPIIVRASDRDTYEPDFEYGALGFRCARTIWVQE